MAPEAPTVTLSVSRKLAIDPDRPLARYINVKVEYPKTDSASGATDSNATQFRPKWSSPACMKVEVSRR
eukprot:scaffold111378_cov30-Prasinocladus_malaysianus.AAC.1